MSTKQKLILEHVRQNGRTTLLEAIRLVGGDIHCNRSDYVGRILSNMVKRGILSRVKPGLFILPLPSFFPPP